MVGAPPPETWTYRSMAEGRRFEEWYRTHLEDLVPWDGLARGDRAVESLARAIFFKERGEVVAWLVLEFSREDESPRGWYDSDQDLPQPMARLRDALAARIEGFLGPRGAKDALEEEGDAGAGI